jgi:hypothetical protein
MARHPGLFACVIAIASLSVNAQAQRIHIQSGTYGGNCGASLGNVTRDLAGQCDERETCRYIVNASVDIRSCPANLEAEWSCDEREYHRAMLSAGANNGDSLMLTCVPSTGAGK